MGILVSIISLNLPQPYEVDVVIPILRVMRLEIKLNTPKPTQLMTSCPGFKFRGV